MIVKEQKALHLQWIENLRQIADKYNEQIYKEINAFIKDYDNLCKQNISNKEFQKQLTDLLEILEKKILDIIYQALEEVYSLTLKYIKKMYGVKVNKKINIEDLTYRGDGLTLEDRLHNHIQEWDNYLSTRENGVSTQELKASINYQMFLIIDTETFAVGNNLVYQKIAKIAISAEIFAGDACEDCRDIEAEGEIPIEKLIVPPFHPNCECSVIYHLGDKVDIEI